MENNGKLFISFSATPDEKKALAEVAMMERQTMSNVIRIALDEWAVANGYPPFFVSSGVLSIHPEPEGDNQ